MKIKSKWIFYRIKIYWDTLTFKVIIVQYIFTVVILRKLFWIKSNYLMKKPPIYVMKEKVSLYITVVKNYTIWIFITYYLNTLLLHNCGFTLSHRPWYDLENVMKTFQMSDERYIIKDSSVYVNRKKRNYTHNCCF